MFPHEVYNLNITIPLSRFEFIHPLLHERGEVGVGGVRLDKAVNITYSMERGLQYLCGWSTS